MSQKWAIIMYLVGLLIVVGAVVWFGWSLSGLLGALAGWLMMVLAERFRAEL